MMEKLRTDIQRNGQAISRLNSLFENTLDRDGLLGVNLARVGATSFEELKTASRYAQVELKSAVDQVSTLRNYIQATDGGVEISTSGEYRVYTDALGTGETWFESGERGRYIPGYEAECGLGVRIPTQTFTGTQKAEWGYFDDNNGVGFGKDAAGDYIFIKRQGVYEKIYQANWNKDTLDGSGQASTNPSGLTLDYSIGVISQIEFIWYGYGAIQWFINIKDPLSIRGSRPILLHVALPNQETSIAQPNLPITVLLDNDGATSAKEMFVGGRQFSVYGQPNERFRINGERRLNTAVVNSEWRPIISFRRKAGVGNNQSVELNGVSVVADNTVIYSFVTGGTLTGASFGNLTDVAPTETVVESDVSATAISGGTFFGGEHVAIGNNQNSLVSILEQLDFDFVNSNPVTLVARSVAASATVDVATLNIAEQW